MASANSRRRTSKHLEQGLGLLEMMSSSIEPCDAESTLPPGQRDPDSFWFPSGYRQPGDIFTPEQRKLQAKQRQVQRHRRERPLPAPAGLSPTPSGYAPIADLGDRAMPLPAPAPELPESAMPAGWANTGLPVGPQAAAARCRLPEADLACVVSARPIVDSRKGSD